MPRGQRPDGVPLRRWIADDLRRRIKAGEFPPGSQLPFMHRLQDEYTEEGADRISPEPVRAALLILETEGLIVGRQGKAVYVREQEKP